MMAQEDLQAMIDNMSATDQKRDAGLVEPDTVTAVKNLAYGPHGVENLTDIYFPKGTTTALPTIVSIHGGGFIYGDKELYRFYTMYLASQGFTVVNFNYRLAPKTHYPAPLEDTNNLMNWLAANAATYHVDMNNLFIVGDSAGGQVAEQYAVMLTNPTYAAKFDFAMAPVKPKAVALNCGVYFTGQNGPANENFPYYIGDTVTPAVAAQFPVEPFITSDFPHAFVMTASDDFLKPLAKPLADLIAAQGVGVDYHLYANPDGSKLMHVFHLDQRSPIAKICNDETLAFFRQFVE